MDSPSTPSADAGQSQPAAGTATAPEANPSAAAADPTQPTQPSGTKPAIKPIPPRERAKASERPNLPGVLRRGNGHELFGTLSRDERGRFTSAGLGDPGDEEDEGLPQLNDPTAAEPDAHEGAPGEVAPERPELPAKPGEEVAAKPAEAPKTFRFADQDFKDQAEAEQNVRSLRGMFKPLQEKVARIPELEKEVQHGYAAGNAWADVAKRALAGQLSEQERASYAQQLGINVAAAPQGRAAAASGQPAGELDSLVDGIDMRAFALIAGDPDGGLEAAGRYLVSEVLRSVKEGLLPTVRAQHEETLAPILAERQFKEASSAADALIKQVAAFQHNGQIAFPELSDHEAVEAIGEIWADMDRPFEELLTPKALANAVALYRMDKSFRAPASPSAGSPTPATTPASEAARPPAGIAASVGGNGGSLAGARRTSGPRDAFAGLDDAQLFDPTLGFRKNRPGRDADL